MDSNEILEKNLPDLKEYNDIELLDGSEFYYRAIYELFIRNSKNIEKINDIINFYEMNKVIIDKHVEVRDEEYFDIDGKRFEINLQYPITHVHEDGTIAFQNLRAMLQSFKGLPYKFYDEGHVYQNKRIDDRIFEIINLVYTATEKSKKHDSKIDTKINDNIYIEYNTSNIVYIKEIGDLIYKETISVPEVNKITTLKENPSYSELKQYLLENRHVLSKSVNVSINNDKYPVINTILHHSVKLEKEVLNSHHIDDALDLLSKNSFILDDLIGSTIDKHKNYLRNMLANNKQEKFIYDIIIYDAKKIYDNKIKKMLIESDLEVDKDTFWVAVSKKYTPTKPTTLLNNYTSVKKIIDDELYLFL